MKISLPRTMALKVAAYLEIDAGQLEASFWDYAENRVTPREMRLEIERLRKWIAQIRAASEPTRSTAQRWTVQMSDTDSVLWDMIWTNWRSVPPPPSTVVLARYDDLKDEKPIRVRACKRGCCIEAGFGSMTLPRWWTATDDQTSPLEYESGAITSDESYTGD